MRTGGPGESTLLLLDVVDLLNTQNIAYAVIGALAAAVHGNVRASMDADALISIPMSQATQLQSAAKASGFLPNLSRGDLDDPISGVLKLSDSWDNRVDLLIGLRGMESQAFARVVDVPFEGQKLKFIGREDFIAMKVFAGGPLDLVDAAQAITAAGTSLDLPLLRRLAGRFGREASAALEHLLTE